MRKCGGAISTVVAIEKKLAAKEDLKMSDLLRYYRDDANAAKELMVRRVKVGCFPKYFCVYLIICLGRLIKK